MRYSHKTVMHGLQQCSHKTTQHGSTIENGVERCSECGAEVNTDTAVYITHIDGTYIYTCGICGNVIKHEYKEDKP